MTLLLLLAACNVWDDLPGDNHNTLDDALWDADITAAADGLYVRLTRAGELARVSADGTVDIVDLDHAQPKQIILAPDSATLLVFTDAYLCDTENTRVETVEDCDRENEEVQLQSRLSLVSDALETSTTTIAAHYNAVQFSNDGLTAVVYLDEETADLNNLSVDGLLNPTEVVFVELDSGVATRVPVGFAADRILFTPDDDRAVVLSRSKVVVVDLGTGNYEQIVSFPLSLDVDDDVRPKDAALTPNGRYALLTVDGSGELYSLDLESESINIVSLDAAPSAMAVSVEADRTVMVFDSRSQVDVLEHDYFDVESHTLEEPANRIAIRDRSAILYNVSGNNRHDVIRLDLETAERIEYRMENPVSSLEIAPDGRTAVALMRTESTSSTGLDSLADANYGVAILDLASDRGSNISLMSETEPVGLAFQGGEDSSTALLLLEGKDDLLQLDLDSGGYQEVALPDTPLGIGAFGANAFYITHDSALGLISFWNPNAEALETVSGFALSGLLTDETLLTTSVED
jgi:hypothetical protein